MTDQTNNTAPFPEKKRELHFLHTLKEIFNRTKGKTIAFRNIIEQLKEEGLLFLIALTALPAAFPIPTPPGFTTIVGLPMCFLTIQLIFRREQLWLPEWILKKQIQVSTFHAGIEKLEPIMNRLTMFLRPRYQRFTTQKMERLAGVVAFLCSVSVTLPILFGNAIPSAAVLIMALGFLYGDGLAVILGMIIGIIGILISSAVAIFTFYFGAAALYKIYEKLSWF
jgi:hypothetical protein